MWRSVFAFSLPALFLAGLSGCAINRYESREAWRDQAEQMCVARHLVQPTAWVSLAKEIDGPGPCGMQQPFRATRLGGGTVTLKQRVTLGCPAMAEAEAWLAETIQPAANLYFGVPVVEINAGSYACRAQNNQAGNKYSEHSYGNALDIMSVTLSDGHVVTVRGGWHGTEAEQGFLREIFTGACARFTTVLAPGSNVFHYDHIHVDLARHDPRGLKRICKPILRFEAQLNPDGTPRATARPFAPRPTEPAEEDPYAVGPSQSPAAARAPAAYARAPARPAAQPMAYASPAPVQPQRPRAPVSDDAETEEPIY